MLETQSGLGSSLRIEGHDAPRANNQIQNKMNITIENITHLTDDEKSMIRCIAQPGFYASLEHFAKECCALLGREWLVYRGGSHVAIHRNAGDDVRILIASE